MRSILNKYLVKLVLVCAILSFCSGTLHAQQDILATYEQSNVLIVDGEIISNVLKVVNKGNRNQLVKILVDFPIEWRMVGSATTTYSINASDSVFIPVRLVPMELVGGNNKFMISANILTQDDRFLAEATFWANTQKHTSWVVNSVDGNKVYFKNGKNETEFRINVLNTGGEQQRITMTMNNLSLFSTITDSLGANKTLKPIQLALGVHQDTTLKFIYRHQSAERNNSRIDIENHRPYTNNEEKTFSLFVNTEEPNLGQSGAFSSSQRIVFKKLSDQTKSNPNAFSTLPVIVDYNVSNLMDNISFSSLNIRGNTQLSANAQVMYNLQSSASSDNYANFLQNTNYYFGYFHAKGNLQAGFVNGGLMGLQSFGRGIKGGYYFGSRTVVNAYYVSASHRNGEQYLSSKGASLQYKFYKQNKYTVEYGESTNDATHVKTSVFNNRATFTFFKTQSINVNLSNSWSSNWLNGTKRHGYFYLFNYSGNFIKNKFNTTHGYGISSMSYTASGIERVFYNHRSRYLISEKWNVTVVNNYNRSVSDWLTNANVTSLVNQVALIRSFKFQSLQLGANYSTYDFYYTKNTVKGLSLNHNTFKPKEYTRFSANIEAGFSTPQDTAGVKPAMPYLLFNGVLFYKTLSVNGRYIMGNYGAMPVINTTVGGITQQVFTSSVQHQYLFKNTKFMLQSGVNYFYNNVFKQHTINLFPEMYYFTQTGWRFRAGVNYNFISTQSMRNAYNNQFANDETQRINNQGFFVSMGVRKEFNAPIPFKKNKYITAEFAAFFDVNGNGIKDRNERAFENVVIRVNEDEVLTNEEGTATILDANSGLARITVIPLDDAQGWFANIPDSILLIKDKLTAIPFVKGVKIKGRVSLKREKVAADSNEPFDLSLIKITAVNGTKAYNALTDNQGNFEFYLPFGDYTITFDERVLGDKFKLTRNHINVQATKDADGLVVSFYIMERVRKINKKVFGQPNPTVPQNDK